MIDTHAHLDFPQFDSDRANVLDECRHNGIEFIVNIGVDLKTSRASIELAEKYDFIYATVGYHPHDAKDLTDSTFAEIKKLAAHPKVVAIGEIGLDYYRNLSPPEIQKQAFVRQLDLADEVNLPVVLHIRQALAETYEILRPRKTNRGILHAFPGDEKEAREGVSMGFHIAFGGSITYPNSRGPAVAAGLPLSRIVTETDCPYLPPQQFRGKRNRPDYIKFVIDKLTEVYPRYTAEDVRRITSKNAGRVLRLPVDNSPQIAYKIGRSLYLNLTSRCTNNCYFCPRNTGFHVAGHNLLLAREPEEADILAAVERQSDYDEIVFCGIGEPTLRAELMLALALILRSKKIPIRLDTNGHGSLINRFDLPGRMKGAIDAVSVSLDAQDAATYMKICSPQFGAEAFDGMLMFAGRCKDEGLKTAFSVVAVPEIDIAACQKIADGLGIPLRIRDYAQN